MKLPSRCLARFQYNGLGQQTKLDRDNGAHTTYAYDYDALSNVTIDSVANALNQITCIGDTAPACTGGTSTTHDAPRAKARILKVPPDN